MQLIREARVAALKELSELNKAWPQPTEGLHHFKTRPECSPDLVSWEKLARGHLVNVVVIETPSVVGVEVVCDFYTRWTIDEVRASMDTGRDDWHVMRQTLKPPEEFTRDRDWSVD